VSAHYFASLVKDEGRDVAVLGVRLERYGVTLVADGDGGDVFPHAPPIDPSTVSEASGTICIHVLGVADGPSTAAGTGADLQTGSQS
jgi:hypothetical protein